VEARSYCPQACVSFSRNLATPWLLWAPPLHRYFLVCCLLVLSGLRRVHKGLCYMHKGAKEPGRRYVLVWCLCTIMTAMARLGYAFVQPCHDAMSEYALLRGLMPPCGCVLTTLRHAMCWRLHGWSWLPFLKGLPLTSATGGTCRGAFPELCRQLRHGVCVLLHFSLFHPPSKALEGCANVHQCVRVYKW
jgi:hypothetical protein